MNESIKYRSKTKTIIDGQLSERYDNIPAGILHRELIFLDEIRGRTVVIIRIAVDTKKIELTNMPFSFEFKNMNSNSPRMYAK
jgi:hypothetical protein